MRKQSGFGAVEVIVLIVVLVLIGVGGWYVWSANQKQQASNNSNNGNNNTTTYPYLGWKAYCDSPQKVCFKYPADWVLSADSDGSATIENPGSTVTVSYANADTRDGAAMPYYTASVEELANPNASFKVLGGYVVPSSGDITPRYKVVDAKFVSSLAAGEMGSTTNTARFTNQSGVNGHLEIYPSDTTGYDSAKAKSWFTSEDAKVARLVARSFYIQ